MWGCHQKLICKVRKNFRKSALENTLFCAWRQKKHVSPGWGRRRARRERTCGMDFIRARLPHKGIHGGAHASKIIFDGCRSVPSRKLKGRTVKGSFGWRWKAAWPLSQMITDRRFVASALFLVVGGILLPCFGLFFSEHHYLKYKIGDPFL